jgi:hypothetical protein
MMFLLPLLAAVTTIELQSGAKLLGWTADGHHLVWTQTLTAYGDIADEMEEAKVEGTASLAVVHDIQRGDRTVFVLKQQGKTRTLLAGYRTVGSATAFEAWKKQHPITRTPGRRGKAGTANVGVKLDEGEAPTWKGEALRWTVESAATVTLSTTCGKHTNRERFEQEMGAMYLPAWTATPIWAPTGRHVVFLLEEAQARTMRGLDGGSVKLVLVACGPRVEVVAPAGLEASSGRLADAVEQAGYAVTSIGAAKQKRSATVIYAPAAHTGDAAKLAKAIPGGATVEKLTWKPKADIVIAVGESAK